MCRGYQITRVSRRYFCGSAPTGQGLGPCLVMAARCWIFLLVPPYIKRHAKREYARNG